MSQQRSMLGRTFGVDGSADDRLVEEITKQFANHPVLRETAILVSCQTGSVTLQGIVHNHEEKALAEGLAKAVPGVRDVINQILVKGGRVA
jgi:osmotically-inducible protein OsmY